MSTLPHEHIDDHGGTAGAVLCGAAAKHRGHRPVRVNSVREQERRLTGAGARNPVQSVPVSFEFRLRGVPSTHAHRRRAVALLPEQLVAAISPAGNDLDADLADRLRAIAEEIEARKAGAAGAGR